MPCGRLTVNAVAMRGLDEAGFGECPTFLGCYVVPQEKHRTRTASGPEPQWNHPLYCDVPEGWNNLQIEVVSEDPERAGVIGGARVNLNQVFAEGRCEDWVSVMGREFESIGQALLVLEFQSFGEGEGSAGAAPYSDEKPMPAPPAERSVEEEEQEEKKVPDWVKYGAMAVGGIAAVGLAAWGAHELKEHFEEKAAAEEEAAALEVGEGEAKEDDVKEKLAVYTV
ncbi:hypothetical protein BDB00DRAFT_890956 [Zychaea mexicana]|uniref:uncharacterized protein n=1 Tax=Zychaea mexicana TaxID=64656 RepID=UPI0022FED6FE|nr:uncharacterized protein BDB00DRAFT_890956 [Zychaea mexicana]KAI9496602.1 hypothetical protein BDB00DRAFT_890956 [Zychaea mexicana]